MMFDKKTLNILAICKKSNRGDFTGMLASLIDGLPSSNYFTKGLKKKYEFHDINSIVKDVFDFGIDNYDRVIKELDELPDIVILEIGAECRNWPISRNPYYQLKAKFYKLGVPVQFVQSGKIRKSNEYILNALALQIYAKLGGTPYVLPAIKTVDRELVIGIGHSVVRSNAYVGNEQNRVVGITTYFLGDGQYLTASRTKDVDYENYFDELLKNLLDTISDLEKSQGWKKGDSIRLVFHIFKPIKNVEFDVVNMLIDQLSKYTIYYAFVTLTRKHPYLIIDKEQTGLKNYKKEVIGKFVPLRGANVKLSPTESLVQMLGPSEMKTNKHGMSKPILIRILTPSKELRSESNKVIFSDIGYITQQIFSFTHLSWRGFLKSDEPATMKYSYLIANQLAKLRLVNGWDSNVVNLLLKRSKWFL